MMDQFRPREDRSQVPIPPGLEELWQKFGNFAKGRGVWIAVIVILILYFASGFYIVGPGEKGVVLLFGKVHSLTDPGLRYRLPKPFMQQIVVDKAKVREAEIGYRTGRGRGGSVPSEALMLTGDENILEVQLFVQYLVQDPVKFLFGAENPEQVLRASAEVALRGAVGENTLDHTMTEGRGAMQKRIEGSLQKLLDSYNTGLLVQQARLLVVDPPAQVKEAFHDVVRALEDRERLMKEAEGYREDVVPKARGQAQQEILEAEAYKAQRVIRADGDARRFMSVLLEYSKAPKVTRERLYLESAERFLPSPKKIIMEGTDSRVLPLLPLARPEGRTQGGETGTASTSRPSTDKKGN